MEKHYYVCDKCGEEMKFAREEANSVEAGNTASIGDVIFKYLLD